MNIAFCIDNRFAVPLTATLHSILSGLSSGTSLHIYIVGEVNKQNRLRLNRVVNSRATLHWLTPSAFPISTDVLKTTENITLATYYRVLLPDLLPPDCRRVIYLDADVIVQGDLHELWEKDFGDNILLAVQDPEVFEVSTPQGLMKYEELGIEPTQPYFNAGVLYLNLDVWRRTGITEDFFTYMNDYRDYIRFNDQDGLNAILYNKWGRLDERWNLQTAALDGRGIKDNPRKRTYIESIQRRIDELTTGTHIVHYTQGRKPWHPFCPHPFRNLFHENFWSSGCFPSFVGYMFWYAQTGTSWLFRKVYLRLKENVNNNFSFSVLLK